MIAIYEAAHVSDAYLVRSLLGQAGIPAWIRGEHLQGALGEVPVTGQIAVCVADADAARARAFVLDWERSVPVPDDASETDAGNPDTPAPRDSPGHGHATALIVGVLLVTVLCWTLVRLLG